jgi:hypothetical protein
VNFLHAFDSHVGRSSHPKKNRLELCFCEALRLSYSVESAEYVLYCGFCGKGLSAPNFVQSRLLWGATVMLGRFAYHFL